MEIFEEYMKLKKSEVNGTSFLFTKKYLNKFIIYVEKESVSLNNFTKEDFKRYLDWLVNHNLEMNEHLTESWFKYHIKYLNAFSIWLNKKEGFKIDIRHKDTEEFLNLFMQKIENKRKIKIEIPNDETIIEQYKNFIEIKNHTIELIKKLIINCIIQLKEYAAAKQKRLIELILSDYEELKSEWLNLTRFASKPLSKFSLRTKLMWIKNFNCWLYNKGYIKEDALLNWNSDSLIKFIQDNRSNKEPVKNRYYTHQELLRAYKKYMNREYGSVYICEETLKDIHYFIEYLVSRNKTIHKSKTETIESFKRYLLKYEYQPGFHYKPETQVKIMRNVKRFYDWLYYGRYIAEHPIKNFKTKEYIKWIKANTKEQKLEQKECTKWYEEIMDGFIKYEQYKGLDERTIHSHKNGCAFYFEYLEKIGIENINEITRENIRTYLLYLNKSKNQDNAALSLNTKVRHIAGLKNLLAYFEKFGLIKELLSQVIEYPKAGRGLSTAGLTNIEIKQLIESADGNNEKSLRARTIFELLYSSGARSNEICQLKINNVNLDAGLIRIDCPKGGKEKERIIPIGSKAVFWLNRYLQEIRKNLPKSEYLFVNKDGKALTTPTILRVVKNNLKKFPFKKKHIVTHSFRVSCGTEMLKNGANIKVVKEQLGHTSIQSTEKYLRLVPTDLKKAHSKYHPRS